MDDPKDSLALADPDYAKATHLIGQKRFAQAVALLEQVVSKDPRNADALNLLGFSVRNLGRFAEALAHYKKALAIAPGHRGAHEYIGETYLALHQPDKARRHLALLDKECWLPCEQYTDLRTAIEAYEARKAPQPR